MRSQRCVLSEISSPERLPEIKKTFISLPAVPVVLRIGDDNMMPPPKIIPLNRKRPPMPVPMPPLPPLPPANGSSETGSDLYEGLKRMTRGRLDDQRGTEINTELPEFLRKPGGQPPDSRVSEPFRLEQGSRTGPPGSRLSGPAGYLGKHYYFITTIL